MESKELSPIEDLKITQSLLQILLSDDMNDIRIEKIKSIFESRESTFKKQIDELQSQLAEKDKEIENIRKESKQHFLAYCKLDEQYNKLQSELTSLKEKHKRDVIKTYIHCKEQKYGNYDLRQMAFDAEQYYTQTHENE